MNQSKYYKSKDTGNLYWTDTEPESCFLLKPLRVGVPEKLGETKVTEDTRVFSMETLAGSPLEEFPKSELLKQKGDWYKRYAQIEVTVPAGVYYIGDPGYAFSDSDAWDEILDTSEFFKTKMVGKCQGYEVYAARTFYGDGYVTAENDSSMDFPVDSGLIGLVPEELVDEFKEDSNFYLMHKVKFGQDIVFSRDYETGTLRVGEIVIETGPKVVPPLTVSWGEPKDD